MNYMDSKKDGGNAFPTAAEPGMTLRDWFAGQAICGMLAGKDDKMAKWAYQRADAMLKRREQERKE